MGAGTRVSLGSPVYAFRRESPGVFIVSQQTSIGAAIEELLLIWSSSEAEEWINRILYLPL